MTQTKLEFKQVTTSPKKPAIKVSTSYIKAEIINEDSSSNDALLCEIAQEIETKHNILKQQEAQSIGIRRFSKVVIEEIAIKEVSPDINSSTSKKSIFNLKRLREIDSDSSDDEPKKPVSILSINSKKSKFIDDDTSDDNTKTKSEYFKNPIKSPTDSTKIVTDKTADNLILSNQQTRVNTVTGENVNNKRTTQLIKAPPVLKKSKLSLNIPMSSNISNKSTSSIPSPLFSKSKTTALDVESSSSESEENEAPKLNSFDLQKKKILESFKNKQVIKSLKYQNKAREDMEKQKFKERNSALNRMPTKQTVVSGELSATQQTNLAKMENMIRLQKVINARQIEQLNKNNSVPSVSKHLDIQTASNTVKPNNSVSLLSNNQSLKIKPKEPSKKDPTAIKTIKAIDKNDVVGSIINKMEKQKVEQTNLDKNNKNERTKAQNSIFSTENFLYRILNWRFEWLIEQGNKYLLRFNFKSKHNKTKFDLIEKFNHEKFSKKTDANRQPNHVPVVQDNELTPIVDKYVNYDEYYKAIFPFLLLETWEEISKAYRENLNCKKEKTYGNIPIWSKVIEINESFSDMSILTCQSNKYLKYLIGPVLTFLGFHFDIQPQGQSQGF